METSDVGRKCCDSKDETTCGERNWEKIPLCISQGEVKQQMKHGRGSCRTALGRNEAEQRHLKENSGLGNYIPSQGQQFSKPAPAAAADVA